MSQTSSVDDRGQSYRDPSPAVRGLSSSLGQTLSESLEDGRGRVTDQTVTDLVDG